VHTLLFNPFDIPFAGIKPTYQVENLSFEFVIQFDGNKRSHGFTGILKGIGVTYQVLFDWTGT
jgi:hypothetical protein